MTTEITAKDEMHVIWHAKSVKDLHKVVKGIMFSDLMEGHDDFDLNHPIECRAIGQKVSEILTILESLDPSCKYDPTKGF